MISNYINHIFFCLDASGSMRHLADQVIKVFDLQIAHLAITSKEIDQETRVSCYVFADDVQCLFYDMDVLRVPSIKGYYQPDGQTNLIGATIQAIEDLKKTPQLYGQHAMLGYVLTDSAHNVRGFTPADLKSVLNALPDNFTIGCLVPDATAIHEAKKCGFEINSIQKWDLNAKGLSEAGEVMRQATDNFMRARATGVRSTKNLFDLNAANLTTAKIKNNLQELSPKDYDILNVRKEGPIKEFVESWIKTGYVVGSAYYALTKPEKIQASKNICIQNKKSGKVYTGDAARDLLSLPAYEVKVNPADFGEFVIYCQSTSTNRKLVAQTQLIVMK